jgi:hypothetical protein
MTRLCCAVLCSDRETPCYNLVPAEITLKICQKIKVSLQPRCGTCSPLLQHMGHL